MFAVGNGTSLPCRHVDDGTITLAPTIRMDKPQAYSCSDTWQMREREANQDIAEGRCASRLLNRDPFLVAQ